MKIRFVMLGCVGLILTGCSNLQLYNGPKQPATSVVMIDGMSSLDISAGGLAVKVCKFDGKPLSPCQPFIEFLPGEHTLTIELTDFGVPLGEDVDVTKTFVAGDRYELDVQFSGAGDTPIMTYTKNVNKKDAGN